MKDACKPANQTTECPFMEKETGLTLYAVTLIKYIEFQFLECAKSAIE